MRSKTLSILQNGCRWGNFKHFRHHTNEKSRLDLFTNLKVILGLTPGLFGELLRASNGYNPAGTQCRMNVESTSKPKFNVDPTLISAG
jgi:hypothetical protein